MNEKRIIAIEGCIGIGKSTLADKLARRRGAKLIQESFEKNPFLEEFYADPSGNILENSLQFLLLHYFQLKSIQKGGFSETITDFSCFKDGIFSEVNLSNPREKQIFERTCDLVHSKLPTPNLTIYIRGSNELVLERIRLRNRLMESKMEPAYFQRINASYESFFSSFRGPLITIDALSYDCVQDPGCIDALSNRINTFFDG